MKTFIVPTDFSETSKNAAIFAAELATAVQDTQVILYYEFDAYLPGSDSSPLSDEPEARQKIAEMALQNVRAEMQAVTPQLPILYEARQDDSFIDGIEKFIGQQRADLLIMGLTETSGLEHTLLKSNSLKLVDRNLGPIMIIPPKAHFKGLSNVLFAADFKDIESATTAANMKAILDMFRPVVHVVNVDEDDTQLREGFAANKDLLETVLQGYEYHFHFLRQADFAGSINQFVADKNIDMIVTLPKKHSFLSRLFQGSHTRQLVYSSYVPVIAIPEEMAS